MNKMRITGALAVVAALAVMVTAIPAGSQAPQERQTLTFFDPNKTDYERFINEGKQGLSPGDVIMFIEKQLDAESCEPNGQLVGKLQIIKTIGDRDALYSGDFTLRLPNGKITAGGAGKFSEFNTAEPIFAVTGGTETYRDASGEVTIEEDVTLCGKKGALVTVDIGPQK